MQSPKSGLSGGMTCLGVGLLLHDLGGMVWGVGF